MPSYKKYALAAVIVTFPLFAYGRNLHQSVPPDFRDMPRYTALNTLEEMNPAGVIGDVKVPDVSKISKGDLAGNDPSADVPIKPVNWITIPGGQFMMGTDSSEQGFKDTKPIHKVAIKTFDMSETDVTVEQYAECVVKGRCTKPRTGNYCNWEKADRQLHPINCVDWNQAQQYARFKGARLPSEAEWEYAATSGGRNQKYPWGNDEPACDKAVMYGDGGNGCGANSTMPVCSKPAGNTAQGLCDMAGNVWQWVQDVYKNSYKGAPADGAAFEGEGSGRVVRGGSFYSREARYLRAVNRYGNNPGYRNDYIGFRLAR